MAETKFDGIGGQKLSVIAASGAEPVFKGGGWKVIGEKVFVCKGLARWLLGVVSIVRCLFVVRGLHEGEGGRG